MLFPRRRYGELLTLTPRFRPWHALRRPLLFAVVLGTSLTLAATASVSVQLVLPTMLWWSVAPLLQVVAAILLVASAPDRRVSLARGVDLVLAGHTPVSLWLLGISAGFALVGVGRLFEVFALAALAAAMFWRALLLYHCCRFVLACDPRAAAARTLVHQGLMWGLLLVYAAWAVALPARV